MKQCDICGEHEACVEVKRMEKGLLQEMALCAGCAKSHGMNLPLSVAALLLGEKIESADGASGTAEEEGIGFDGSAVRCPACRMRVLDFRQTGRLGCAECYDAWREVLDPMLLGMHRSLTYKGCHPVGAEEDPERIRAEIGVAVAEENYEKAATLRDRLRALEQDGCGQQREFPFHACS